MSARYYKFFIWAVGMLTSAALYILTGNPMIMGLLVVLVLIRHAV